MRNRPLHILLALVAMVAMVALSACEKAAEDAPEGAGDKETSAAQTPGDEAAEGDEPEGTDEAAATDEAASPDAQPDDPAVAPDPTDATAAVDGHAIDTLAAALPADTMLLASIDTASLVTAATPGGDDGLRADLRKDIGTLFASRYKFDPSQAPWVGFAAGKGQWMAMVVGGKVDTSAMQTVDIAGKQAWVVNQGVSVLIELNGLQLITGKPMAEKLLADTGPRLAASPDYKLMQGAVAQLGSQKGLTVVGKIDPALVESFGLPIPPAITNLDAIALSLGKAIEIVATGTPDEIKAVATLWGVARSGLLADVNSEYEGRAELDLDDQLGVITAKHAVDSLLNAWEPTFDNGVARVVIDPAVFANSSALLVTGLGSALLLTGRAVESDIAPAQEAVAVPIEVVPDEKQAPADTDDDTQTP